MSTIPLWCDQAQRTPLNVQIADKLAGLIEQGTYGPGERIPSIRELSRQMRVSANTVMQAYAHLESKRIIEARPQSGYYVCRCLRESQRPNGNGAPGELVPSRLTLRDRDLPLAVVRNISNPALAPLGRGIPNCDLLPMETLNRMLGAAARRFPTETISYASSKGLKRLRTQIARRSLDSGCSVSPEDMVITSGCVEAVTLALHATCRPGDTVAIESPACCTFLHSLQWLGLKVLEVPSTPNEGMSLDVLDYATRNSPIRACIVISNFNNPAGSLMPDEKKRDLVALLAKHEIPLIEDDVYGDLAFDVLRPTTAKAYDKKGLVLLCSSFSKTLAPGYRVGWIVPGRFYREVERLKTLFNVATPSATQLAIAEFLTNGGYDRHLRAIRRVYARQMNEVRSAIARHFPGGTHTTRPAGGFVLWVEMPEAIDSFKLYEAAIQQGIAVAPGNIFATDDRFRNYIRVNTGYWSEKIDHALQTVGSLARAQL